MKGIIDVDYVFQDIDNLPGGLKPHPDRSKPWGTSHAIMVAASKIKEPFGVINSDDYYGVKSFSILYDFLVNDKSETNYCIVGYKMENTLSDHGHVNRGVCRADKDGMLQHIVETRKIEKTGKGIFAPTADGGRQSFTGDEIVSMNLFGFKPSCFGFLEEEFTRFIHRSKEDPNAELDIPTSMDVFIKSGEVTIKVLMTDDKWFGVTYREDRPFVVENLEYMTRDGIYPSPLR
ncbi:MAG: nucleotidyltransferase [Bacteroidia bacterium]|nr:MAG: nucleotidyltransferase [Bacteroidia bacterium]